MNGLAGSIAPPGTMYVRALYDYDADDRTSLSFRQGEIIQVITQLESGWWDGIISGVRGWFPSNYCELIAAPAEDARDNALDFGVPTMDHAEESDGEFGEDGLAMSRTQHSRSRLHLNNRDSQEEAAFWIPQATPDGRLFYFNTLTGVSTMELPLETPTSINESGPRDRTNVYLPDQTRPPPEMLAGGYERQDDTDYESESDMMMASRGSLVCSCRLISHTPILNACLFSPANADPMYQMVYHLPRQSILSGMFPRAPYGGGTFSTQTPRPCLQQIMPTSPTLPELLPLCMPRVDLPKLLSSQLASLMTPRPCC